MLLPSLEDIISGRRPFELVICKVCPADPILEPYTKYLGWVRIEAGPTFLTAEGSPDEDIWLTELK